MAGQTQTARSVARRIANAATGQKIHRAKKGNQRRIKAMGRKALNEYRSFGFKLAKVPSTHGTSVASVRQKLGVTQEEFARVTGYSTRSIAGWEAGQRLSDSARQKLIETDRLRVALGQIMPAENLAEWLRAPNPAFENQTPLQVIERGESDRLWRMVFQIDANVAS